VTIERNFYLNKLIEKQDNGLIKIITGIRRCGKSYLLDPIFKNYLLENNVDSKHIIKIDFDIKENAKYLDPDYLNSYIKSQIKDDKKYYILLDEIQWVPDFETVLNGFLKLPNLEVYVTGSNSKFLSSDIITEFRGRSDEIRVYPLSFSEFYSVRDGDLRSSWKEYITFGGLPLILQQKTKENKIDYLKTQRDNVYINDVIERNNVKNGKDLRILIEIISSSIGSLTNPLKLSKVFKGNNINSTLTDKTIYNYLKYLQESFLICKSIRYDIKGKKYIDTPQKYYFTDIGIRNSFLDFRQIEENHIMENIIYIELLKRGFNVDVGVVEYSCNKKLEIDFIANKGSEKYYIQSVLNIDTKEKQEQEFRPFRNINDFFKRIIIVKEDVVSYTNDEGILIIGIFDFLLNEGSL